MATDADWPRVRALFETASALAPAARAAFLQQLVGGDAELRAAVAALLAAEARDDAFLEPPLPWAGAPSLVGRRIGTVWEAEQDEPRRKVALKTMHSGLASAPARRRFRFEAELLATLRHPAIAQVYGAGVLAADAGDLSLPWFALEFVEGARPL